MANYDGYEPFYIIHVDLKGIDVKKDYGLYSHGDHKHSSAYYTKQTISPDRLKVVDKA